MHSVLKGMWNRYKDLAAIRGLLQWIGLWDYVTHWGRFVIGGVIAGAFSLWGHIWGLPGPHVAVLGLAVLALVIFVWDRFDRIRWRRAHSNFSAPAGFGPSGQPPTPLDSFASRHWLPAGQVAELTPEECRVEWSEFGSARSLRCVIWNGTPHAQTCIVQLVKLQRWSDAQTSFVDVYSTPLYRFEMVRSRPIPETDHRSHEIVKIADGGGSFVVLGSERDQTLRQSQVGIWRLTLSVRLGARSRSQYLEFEWSKAGLAPKYDLGTQYDYLDDVH